MYDYSVAALNRRSVCPSFAQHFWRASAAGTGPSSWVLHFNLTGSRHSHQKPNPDKPDAV